MNQEIILTNRTQSERGGSRLNLLIVVVILVLVGNAGYNYIPVAYEGEDLGLALVYPNPLNPERYIAILAGAHYGSGLPGNHPFSHLPDALIYRSQTVSDPERGASRVFGKPSNGAFTPSDNPFLGNEWHFSRGTGSGYLIEDHQYLAHTGAPIDEEVWFTLDDVIAGRDTVAASAISWILEQLAQE